MRYPGTVSTNGKAPRVTTADEWRKRRLERVRGKAVPLTLPSGVVVKVSRPPLETWFGTAKLPETLSRNVVEIFGSISIDEDVAESEKAVQAKVEAIPEDEQQQLLGFMTRLLLEGVVEPKLVDKAPEDCTGDEYALSDLEDEERAFILYYLMSGVPAQPVPVANGGEVSLEQLKKFRGKKRSTNPRKASRKVPRTTKRTRGTTIPE